MSADIDELAASVIAGDRTALARAITLVESTRPDHRAEAGELLDRLLPRTGGAHRVAVSGAPGAGKSTFLERFGLRLVDAGHHIAVLAVDPSSKTTGGSILADKTRMNELSKRAEAFIRPTPSGGSLGGVARRTREVGLLCEAAGFDVVLIETVGVGQSETSVSDLVDTFVLLVAPAGGDEMQAIKRGVMELADIIVVTKCDGELVPAAQRAVADHRAAVHLLRPRHPSWPTEVLAASAVTGEGVDEVWQRVEAHRAALRGDGSFDAQRAAQAVAWLHSEIEAQLLDALRGDPAVAARLKEAEADVLEGRTTPGRAADQLLDRWRPAHD